MRDRVSLIRHDSRMCSRDPNAIPPQGVIEGAQTSTTTLAPGPVLDRNVELGPLPANFPWRLGAIDLGANLACPDGRRLPPRRNALRKKVPRDGARFPSVSPHDLPRGAV